MYVDRSSPWASSPDYTGMADSITVFWPDVICRQEMVTFELLGESVTDIDRSSLCSSVPDCPDMVSSAVERIGELDQVQVAMFERELMITAMLLPEKSEIDNSCDHVDDCSAMVSSRIDCVSNQAAICEEELRTFQSIVKLESERLWQQGMDAIQRSDNTEEERVGFELVKWSADLGNECAQWRLGDLYSKGIGCLNNGFRSMEYYKRSAEQGNAVGQTRYGEHLGLVDAKFAGNSAELHKLSAELHKLSADQNNSEGQRNYGLCLLTGFGVNLNPEEGVRYMRSAASQGDMIAQYVLGLCFMKAFGVQKSEQEAVDLWRQSAEYGCVPSMNRYGNYLLGLDDPVARMEAFRYFKLAREKGDLLGEFLYGHCLEYGIGVEVDVSGAETCYRNVCERIQCNHSKSPFHDLILCDDLAVEVYKRYVDNYYACYLYGFHLENGIGCEKNEEEAVKWYNVSADNRNGYGQNGYGRCLQFGKGVATDLVSAAKYYRMSAQNRCSEGQKNYGCCLMNGLGVIQNSTKAVQYFVMSANQGNSDAYDLYGNCLLHGCGAREDVVAATSYFKLSADQGNAFGQIDYGICLKHGIGVNRDYREAARYFSLSAAQGHATGQSLYGLCLLKGDGVSRDEDAASYYFYLAAEQGDMFGQFMTGIGFQERDPELAVKYLQLAANQCNIFTRMINSSGNYVYNSETVYEEFFNIYQSYAEDGNSYARYIYGHCLMSMKKLCLAAEQFKLLCDEQKPLGHYAYGMCCATGHGVKCNLSKASQYLQLAADQGYPEAQYCYALMLIYGKGVDRNLRGAVNYLRLAVHHGHVEALRCYRSMLAKHRNFNEYTGTNLVTYSWHQKLHNVEIAPNNYVLHTAYGKCVDQDPMKDFQDINLCWGRRCPDEQSDYKICLCDCMGIDQDPVKDVRDIKSSADQSSLDEQSRYLVRLYDGKCVDQDHMKDLHDIKSSADQSSLDEQSRYLVRQYDGKCVDQDHMKDLHDIKSSADEHSHEDQLSDWRCVDQDPVKDLEDIKLYGDQSSLEEQSDDEQLDDELQFCDWMGTGQDLTRRKRDEFEVLARGPWDLDYTDVECYQ